MAIKTISLELDAYERLKRAKRARESFPEVVRRARLDTPKSSGSAILAETSSLYKSKKGAPSKAFDYFEHAAAEDATAARITPSKWGGEA